MFKSFLLFFFIFLNLFSLELSKEEKYCFFAPIYNICNDDLFLKKSKPLDFNNINNLKPGYIKKIYDSTLIKKFHPNLKNLVSSEDNPNFDFSLLENIPSLQLTTFSLANNNFVNSNADIKNKNIIKKITISNNFKFFIFMFSISSIIILTLFYFLRKAITATKKERLIAKTLIESFEAANELNDEDTGNHILRVNLYSKFLAEKLKCHKKFINEIGEYASLHDIGKIGVSDSILKKPGKLSPYEFEEMKKHVLFGKKLVDKMQLGDIAQNIALYHHEKWNGKGYYYGLKENKIPLEARIVSLADVYDVLRQKRVYKDGFSHEEAIEIIKKESGQHFDPTLVGIFLEFNEEFNKIFIKH